MVGGCRVLCVAVLLSWLTAGLTILFSGKIGKPVPVEPRVLRILAC